MTDYKRMSRNCYKPDSSINKTPLMDILGVALLGLVIGLLMFEGVML